MMIDFGREVCSNLPVSQQREWLVTNGLGGYAAGTVSSIHTRRYHGLLIAALKPPLGRTLLLSRLDETIDYAGRSFPLFANRWRGDLVEPEGFRHLARFRLEGMVPVWAFDCGDALIEKRVWMQRGANTTYVRYDVLRAGSPLVLRAKALVNYRDHHTSTHAGGWQMEVEAIRQGLRIVAFDGATPFTLTSDRAVASPDHTWYRDYLLSIEAERGLDPLDDNLCAGEFAVMLQPGESCTFAASSEPGVRLDGRAIHQQQKYQRQLLKTAGIRRTATGDALNDAGESLILAADQFIVRRGEGHSIIAGYPWFGDWGRDTMISLPGLALATHRYDAAASILRTFARYVDQGMLPNRFPDEGEAPDYNTADAALWYFEAIRATLAATADDTLLRDLFPVLEDMIHWHRTGTRHGIHVDPADGLLYAGEPGVQLTWMDARVGDWVVTPRIGKAVEINALWYNALRSMSGFASALGQSSERVDEWAEQAGRSFARFWNDRAAYCYDVIDGPQGDDSSLRPNQLFAVSLYHSPLEAARQRAIVEACSRALLTPHGLRSLSPDDPRYVGHYGGDRLTRDSAYHQGTVWAWLIGPFVEAHLRVYGDRAAARELLRPLIAQMQEHSLGSIGEVFDGDPPFSPRGCFAQAWSVAEVLRLWRATL